MRKITLFAVLAVLLFASLAWAEDWRSAYLQDNRYLNNGVWQCNYEVTSADYAFSINYEGTGCPTTVWIDMETKRVKTK